jgi:hypothetical protein
MTKTTQIFLILFGSILVLGIGLVGAGVYWFKAHGAEMLASMSAADSAGRQFGVSTDNQGCITDALAPGKQTISITEVIRSTAYLHGCLEASRVTPGFCDSVPSPTAFTKSISWTQAQCAKVAAQNPFCSQIMGNVQRFCHLSGRSGSGPPGAA